MSTKGSRSAGYVYLVQVRDTDFYKVGYSQKSAEGRIKELQTANPLKLDMIDVFYSNYARMCESYLHYLLQNFRSGGGSEWFALTSAEVNILRDAFSVPGSIVSSIDCKAQTLEELWDKVAIECEFAIASHEIGSSFAEWQALEAQNLSGDDLIPDEEHQMFGFWDWWLEVKQ